MAVIKRMVYAHWTDIPPPLPSSQVAPPPVSLTTSPPYPPYPAGSVPLLDVVGTGQQYSPTIWTTNPRAPIVVWCEVASQTDIDAANWSGLGWPGPQPPSSDEGYNGPGITDLKVTDIDLFLTASVNNTEFDFTVRDPQNNIVGTVTPTTPAIPATPTTPLSYKLSAPVGGAIATVTSGRGIWTIEITRVSGSAVAPPGLYLGGAAGNPVNEPYVSPYGNQFEGILGLIFTGEEVFSCPTVTGRVELGECNADGTRLPSSLIIEFNPPLAANTQYDFWWILSAQPPVPAVHATGTVTAAMAPLSSLSQTVNYSSNTVLIAYPKALGTITLPGGVICPINVDFSEPPNAMPPSVTVQPCPQPPPPCEVNLRQDTPIEPTDCAPLTLNFTATTTPAGYTGPYTWEVQRVGAGNATTTLLKKTPVPPDPTLSHPFPTAGIYNVIVSIQTPNCVDEEGNPSPSDSTSLQVEIPDCCPQFAGLLTGTEISACEWLFSVQVTNPQNVPVTYDWTFHDGQTAQTSKPSVTHTYSSTAPASGRTTVALSASGCTSPTPLETTFTLNCGTPTPPTVTGCSASAGMPGTITVTFSEDVNGTSAETPGNYVVTVQGVAQTLAPGSLSYNSTTRMVTISGLTISAGDSVSVTVTNVSDLAGNPIVANGQTNGCTTTAPIPPTRTSSTWCLILLVIWIIGFLALGVTTALGAVWYIILIAGIVYTIALVLWNALCCWPCSMRPWACCGLLQWHMIATVWLLQILAVLAFFSLGSAYVGASYATLLSILFGLLGGARCTIPNPYAPTTWPPACCPGSLCP